MVTRRTFLNILGALLAVRAADAQQPGKVARVGFLSPADPPPAPTPGLDVLRQGLRDLGWIEGRTVILETRFAGDHAEKLPALAMELVRVPVDVLVTVATAATQAAQKATRTIPIVMYPVGDPVSAGFVASLARPGGNITGVALNWIGRSLRDSVGCSPPRQTMWSPGGAVSATSTRSWRGRRPPSCRSSRPTVTT